MTPEHEPLPALTSVVRAVLAREALTAHTVTVLDVHDRPGAETSVRVAALTERGLVGLVVTDADVPASATVAIATTPEDGGRRYAVWAHPHDPLLPGLATALDAAAVARLLGIGGAVELDLIAYRPMRRAVIRAHQPGTDQAWYLKVLRPARADGPLAAARSLGSLTPQPELLAPGLLAIPQAPGIPLLDLVADPAVTAAQVVSIVAEVTRRMPDAVLTLPARPSWAARRRVYARHALARGLDPAHVGEVLEAVDEAPDPGQIVPTHGDLHLTNVRTDHTQTRMAALIDVDTVGPGHRVDDLACLVAHIAALPALNPDLSSHTQELALDVAAEFAQWPECAGIYAHAAAVLLSLAATADDQSLATPWLAAAADLAREGRMRDLSRPSPRGFRSHREPELARPQRP